MSGYSINVDVDGHVVVGGSVNKGKIRVAHCTTHEHVGVLWLLYIGCHTVPAAGVEAKPVASAAIVTDGRASEISCATAGVVTVAIGKVLGAGIVRSRICTTKVIGWAWHCIKPAVIALGLTFTLVTKHVILGLSHGERWNTVALEVVLCIHVP